MTAAATGGDVVEAIADGFMWGVIGGAATGGMGGVAGAGVSTGRTIATTGVKTVLTSGGLQAGVDTAVDIARDVAAGGGVSVGGVMTSLGVNFAMEVGTLGAATPGSGRAAREVVDGFPAGSVDVPGGSNHLAGYSQDINGRWHRSDGTFASNADVGLPSSQAASSSGSHGNSLDYEGVNYGYALVRNDTNEILKFGETIHPKTRYSQSFLDSNNARMEILETGSKVDIHNWQFDMNNYYLNRYDNFPPLVDSPTGY